MTLVQRRPQPLARTTVHRGGVLVAWLGGSGDAAALRWALSWAHLTAREVTVLVTGQAATPGTGYRSDIASALGVPVAMTEAPFLRILELSGDPVAALLTAGIRADVLVVPTGGPAPIPNRSLGRTVERVVARHPGAVVVVPALYREDEEGRVVVGHDVEHVIVNDLARYAPIVRADSPAAMIDASRSASLVVARCQGHHPGALRASCQPLHIAASAWCPVLTVHA